MRLSLNTDAWDRGFHDGEQGKPLRPCPYEPGTTESWSWVSGYIEGKAARNGCSAARPDDRPRSALRR
jgi:ribosome modulation factor